MPAWVLTTRLTRCPFPAPNYKLLTTQLPLQEGRSIDPRHGQSRCRSAGTCQGRPLVTRGSSMLVTFIKPTLGCLDDGERFVDEARMEPLSLGILAGLTPPGVDCRRFDDRIDELDYEE